MVKPSISKKPVSKKPPASKSLLKAKKKVIFEVDYHDLEDAVKKEYRQEFNFVADQECGNDSTHDFTVDGVMDDEESMQEFRKTGESTFLTGNILNDLAARGLIEKGTYLVQVCW